MGSGALIFNPKGELLIVKPSYKNHWSIPGGVVDKNESPRKACLREVKEEVGIRLRRCTFALVDYGKAAGVKSENLQFIFWGGKLTKREIAQIKIDQVEIENFQFVKIKKAFLLVNPHLKKRMQYAVREINKGGIYLENGIKK